jgi:glycosyltransferase involved in cell wall biosynthesis
MFPELIAKHGASAALQLNGMMPPAGKLPVLAHNQDPWPYRPEAWDMGFRDRALAFLRRRAHGRAFKQANVVGFTSNYLRDLMIQWLRRRPRQTEVFYNGLPETWIDRTRKPLPSWRDRPMELISISSVGIYKRQELVIRCMPELLKRPGTGDLIYRIIGHHNGQEYAASLAKLARDLGISERIIIEGRVPDERLELVMTRARAYVLMSVCESFGLPAIEAMSFGVPVVVSNCCAMPEVCASGAILSPVDDVSALTENLYRVLTDESVAEPLRQRGAQNVQRFHWRDTAAKMAVALDDIMQS